MKKLTVEEKITLPELLKVITSVPKDSRSYIEGYCKGILDAQKKQVV